MPGEIYQRIFFTNIGHQRQYRGQYRGHNTHFHNLGKISEEKIGNGYCVPIFPLKDAGLSEYIDAKLADAHQLVNESDGLFDFVFIDADKEWYVNYAKALIPKLEDGGCMTAHNVYQPRSGRGSVFGRRGLGGTGGYYEFMKSQLDFETTILPESRGGLAVSYKKKQ